MQPFRPMALQAVALLSSASGASYGPGGCVSIRRSSVGTCVLQTKCDNHDVTNFDFAFDCVISTSNSTTHDLGIGSLDTEEEYDTGVQCGDCQPPKSKAKAVIAKVVSGKASVGMPTDAQKLANAPHAHTRMFQQKSAEPHIVESKGAKAESAKPKSAKTKSVGPALIQDARSVRSIKQGPTQVQRYGPGLCVKTWRDSTNGHCIMETDCPASEDLTVYEFGLMCEGQGGELTRHVFGQDSFEHHETFDTLIECEDCLALDEYMDAGKSITFLAQEVEALKAGMENVTADISKLEAAVGGPGPAPAPAPAAPATAAAELMAHRQPTQAHHVKQARAAVQHTASAKRTKAKIHSRQTAAHVAHRAAVVGHKAAGGQQKHLRHSQRRHREADEEDEQEEVEQAVGDDEGEEDGQGEEAEQEATGQTQEGDEEEGGNAQESDDDARDASPEDTAAGDGQQADGEEESDQ